MSIYFLTDFFKYFFRVLHEASYAVKVCQDIYLTPCMYIMYIHRNDH
jgi:hypothetical protein